MPKIFPIIVKKAAGGFALANVLWGPNFGEAEELIVNAVIDQPTIGLDWSKEVQAHIDGDLVTDLVSDAVTVKTGAHVEGDLVANLVSDAVAMKAAAQVTMPQVEVTWENDTPDVGTHIDGDLATDLVSDAVKMKTGANLTMPEVALDRLSDFPEAAAHIDGDLAIDLLSDAVVMKVAAHIDGDLAADLVSDAVKVKTGVNISLPEAALDSTDEAQAHIDGDLAIDLLSDAVVMKVAALVTMPSVDIVWLNDTPDVGTHIDGDLAADLLSSAVTVKTGAHIDGDLATVWESGFPAVGSRITMPSLALDQIRTARAHVSGEASGAPFYQSNTTATATGVNLSQIDVSKPADTASGDLLLIFVGARGGVGGPTWSVFGGGWTVVQSTNTALVKAACLRRVADGSEGATFSVQSTGLHTHLVVECHRIAGIDTGNPIDVSANATLIAADLDPDPDSPSVTTTVANTMVFAYLAHDHAALNQTHTPAAGHAERTDSPEVEADDGATVLGGHSMTRVFAAIGATGTATHNCTETVATDAVMIRVAVAPGTLTLAA